MSAFGSLLNYMAEISRMSEYLGMSSIPSSKSKTYNVYKLSPKPAQERNEPCNCGSGKKYKKCCGKEV